MPKNMMLIRVLFASVIVMSIAGPVKPAEAKPPLKFAIMRQEHRNEYVQFETVIEALDITSGMTILDIGSGPGYASFLFAEELRGSGKVFATDIREDFVNYISDEAKRRGLTNLFSVAVKAEGLDNFYGKHQYDLVFLSNVYHCFDNRIEYFSKLRGFLKQKARLVIVLYNQVPVFSVDDFSNADGLVDNLSRETDDNPFYKNLSAGTKKLLGDHAKGDEIERALVDDFNRMLVDPRFYKGFYSDSYFRKNLFTVPEREFANWLLMTLEEDGVLEKPADQLSAKALRTVMKLNRLFFMKKLGGYLAGGGMGAYIPAGDANRHTSKYVMLRELDAAGYEYSSEINLSPYFDAVIMVPKTP
jgi:SAM-dependent methyltransferase